jgi:hypothetical protein
MNEKLMSKLPVALLFVQVLLLSLIANSKDQFVTIMTGMLATFITGAWVVWETLRLHKKEDKDGTK